MYPTRDVCSRSAVRLCSQAIDDAVRAAQGGVVVEQVQEFWNSFLVPFCCMHATHTLLSDARLLPVVSHVMTFIALCFPESVSQLRGDGMVKTEEITKCSSRSLVSLE